MIKALLTAGSVPASTSIPLTLDTNTNYKTDLNNNAIELKTAGLWDIKANVNLTATTTGNITVQLYANGTAVPGALATITVASGDEYAVNINDVVKTVIAYGSNVKLTLMCDQAITIVGGDFIVEYVR